MSADAIGVTMCFFLAGAGMLALGFITWAIPSIRHIGWGRASDFLRGLLRM